MNALGEFLSQTARDVRTEFVSVPMRSDGRNCRIRTFSVCSILVYQYFSVYSYTSGNTQKNRITPK
jgi:hypothetical protein